ncbi:putative N-acetyltransferase HLS1 [Cinnamomum micranthum f. kanehirae]|uniref:Putative N-acetyltransferase HLS1 n=1 Tax=Cinnamomum micranthum f. kanehirae TaxID=337451 RepID=A0A443NHK1_9MAGN|nr:putative N-acetyltransferase HLS1 [Cinnamomum micranthum f. kanehirae]
MSEEAVVIRVFKPERDSEGVEMVERRCEVGPSGKMSLFTDLMGDPICRIRHSPAFLMLVAEMRPDREIVGVIRGCIKTVTCGKKLSRNAKNGSDINATLPIYTKLAYILGLRVSPSHSSSLAWRNGFEETEPSIRTWLRTKTTKLLSSSSRTAAATPSSAPLLSWSSPSSPTESGYPTESPSSDSPPRDAETLYRRRFSTTEFFPRDIDSILTNKLSLGTFLALPSQSFPTVDSWPGIESFLSDPPESWAVLSIWNSKEVFRLEVRGASRVKRGLAKTTRIVDRALPWLKIPSVPELFRPFGLHFLYGLGGEGPDSVSLTRALCGFAHNLAKKSGCGVIATEVACRDPLRLGIPHWKKLSCAEDLWCMKRLGEDYSDGAVGDWTKSPPGPSIFVDPREV